MRDVAPTWRPPRFFPRPWAGLCFEGQNPRWTKILLLPIAVALAVVGVLLARPLGPWLQQYVTTEADMGNMQIIDIIPVRKGVHRVITNNSPQVRGHAG